MKVVAYCCFSNCLCLVSTNFFKPCDNQLETEERIAELLESIHFLLRAIEHSFHFTVVMETALVLTFCNL